MAEVRDEATYVRHHPKKIAFLFSAMRHFAQSLRDDGWDVRYTHYDDSENAGSIPGDRFVASHAEFEAWAEGRKQLRMEYFYRDMRRKTGLLMDGDGPEGGKWNFDHDNRKISPYLNAGLLSPLEVCEAAQNAYSEGHAPINAVEGFIRQIIGWREYVRGIYFLEGPDYTQRNALDAARDLPAFYWGAETKMRCVSKAIEQTRETAYAHHIQRLMVTGNFALLAGIDPHQVHEWYLEVYADAYEWVEAPNTVGMSQFADGGIIASKPYVSSGAYINRMSDHCKHCHYKVTAKTGQEACPFNLLYWDFLIRHRERFSNNARMGNMYRTWDRMDEERRQTVLSDAADFLDRLDSGAPV